MKWSQLKKRVEDTFADTVRGRVELWTTRYRNSHDQEGEGWITVDKQRVHSMGTITYFGAHHREASRLRVEGDCEDYQDPNKHAEYLDAHHEANKTMQARGTIALWEFNTALFDYLNMPIVQILASEHLIIRSLGMLDKRVGKRRLKAINPARLHPLTKQLYELRCASEGIAIGPGRPIGTET